MGTVTTVPNTLGRAGIRWAAAGPWLMMLAAAGFLAAHWHQIPAKFPKHWDASGHVNGWGSRSFSGVYGILVILALACVFVQFQAWFALHRAPHENAHERAQARAASWIMLAVTYLLAIAACWVALLPLRLHLPSPLWLLPLVPLAVVAGLIRLWCAQPPEHATATDDRHREQDDFWTAFGFYNNPNDPAVAVAQRNGLGYTLNLGNPHGRRLWHGMLTSIVLFVIVECAASHWLK